ncbi:MAG: phosphoglucosamine mutase [Planctomycetota bacterium]|nr:phosphoglucosamine mutase [Planctomycetota bacterium]
MSRLMLSVSGCRGVIGRTLTPEVAARFAGCFGAFLVERSAGRPVTVVLGRDGRRGSEVIAAAACAGLAGAGCRVIDLGVAATPTVAVETDVFARARPPAAGMVVTASHNPQDWCGLKCLLADGGEFGSAACAPPADLARLIIDRFERAQPGTASWDAIGTIEPLAGAHDEHVERLAEALEAAGLAEDPSTLGEGLKVALDSVNASGAEAARAFLEAVGCEEILHLGAEGDGIFRHPPEPTSENLGLPGGLCDAVRESASDVGFAQDPDADRLAIIDERGRYIGEEYTLALGALALLEARRRRAEPTQGCVLVTNLSTSRMLDDVAARFGARVERTPVGEAHVVETMKRLAAAGTPVLAGGEGNGGLIWPRVTYVRDSLSSMAMILALLRDGPDRRRVSDLVASIPAYAIEKRKVDLPRREDAAPGLERVANAFRAQRLDTRDGVWVDFTHGPLAGRAWLHVRASNTEPILRLIAEAPTPAAARSILDEAGRVLNQ